MRFRFSGHESFPCRYTWLPKAYSAIVENPIIFANDNEAMVRLGVGKNMVKSIRFWVQAFGIAQQVEGVPGLVPTAFGQQLFGPSGYDPFLEDIRTLWLLHWKIASLKDDPLFAWYFLCNQWSEPIFTRSKVLEAFTREAERSDRNLSDFTKGQHFDIFLHTYVPVRARKGSEIIEDSLDCPLTELRFIIPAGESMVHESAKREPAYEFRQDAKIDITAALFCYCLFDFWRTNRANETTISFREVASIEGSIGHIFKLSEPDLRARLESLKKDSEGMFEYQGSAAIPRLIKQVDLTDKTDKLLLAKVYKVKAKNNHAQKTIATHAG